jgi:hypothetical protein
MFQIQAAAVGFVTFEVADTPTINQPVAYSPLPTNTSRPG